MRSDARFSALSSRNRGTKSTDRWASGGRRGSSWEAHLLDAYGIEPDPERIRYYRLLWDLG